MADTYLYETHLHTSPSSLCSDTRGRDYIAPYIDAGYDGIIVTDHFWRGNCGIARKQPWTEFVHQFCAGYEDALNEGLKRNFPVFFGWEETYEGDDYLIYGLDKQWLLEHPEVREWTRKEQFEEVHRFGGCVVQAHPFRAANYIRDIHLSPEHADGIEGFNAGNQKDWNTLGMRYARILGLPVTAGSDNHHAGRMCAENLAGVVLDRPLTCIGDYVQTIREGRKVSLHLPYPVPDWSEEVRPERRVFRHGEDGRPEEISLGELNEWLRQGASVPGRV